MNTQGSVEQEKAKTKRHPFSFTLGEGPFAYVGSYDLGATLAHAKAFGDTEEAFRKNPPPKLESGCGTCAHCGRAILDIKIVRIGNGKLYGVGSDCIMKVYSDGHIDQISKLERDIRNANTEKRQKREAAKIAELTAQFEPLKDKAKGMEHPHVGKPWAEGKTLFDYHEFVLRGSGNAGKIRNLKKFINDLKEFS